MGDSKFSIISFGYNNAKMLLISDDSSRSTTPEGDLEERRSRDERESVGSRDERESGDERGSRRRDRERRSEKEKRAEQERAREQERRERKAKAKKIEHKVLELQKELHQLTQGGGNK